MSLFSAEDKATVLRLLAENGWSDLDPYSAANKLKQPRTRIVTGQVQPKPFKWSEILATLTRDQAKGVLALPAITTIIERAKEQDRPALIEWAESLAFAQMISSSQKDAIEAILNATEPAPDKVETYDSVFAEAFPNFEVMVHKKAIRMLPNGQPERDEEGNDLLFDETVIYNQCPPELVIEARS